MRLWLGVLLLSMSCSLMEVPDPASAPDAGGLADTGAPSNDPCTPNPCTEPLKRECSVVADEAVCSCVAEARPVGDVCVPSEACDDGDCVGGAIELQRDLPYEGTLNREGSDATDWFLLKTQSAGGIEGLRVELIGDSGPDGVRQGGAVPVVPNIRVFLAPDYVNEAQMVPRDGVEADGRFHRLLRLDVPAGSVVFVRLDDADSEPVAYRLTATAFGADDHGDGATDASTVEAGDHGFVFETRNDTDVFAFEATASGALLAGISLVEAGENVGSISLRIGSESGTDARRYYGRARHAVEPGTYLIRVDHRTRRLVSGSLHLSILNEDDHGDTAELATPLAAGSGQVVTGTLVDGDQDWFAFPAVQDAVYRIVYEGTGALQGRRADEDAFVWNHSQGDHYRHDGLDQDVVLSVSGAAHDYRLMIFTTEITDTSGNRITSASTLAGYENDLESALDYVGDVDHFGPLLGPGQLCAQIEQPGGGMTLQVLDQAGEVLGATTDGAAPAAPALPLGLVYFKLLWTSNSPMVAPAEYRVLTSEGACP